MEHAQLCFEPDRLDHCPFEMMQDLQMPHFFRLLSLVPPPLESGEDLSLVDLDLALEAPSCSHDEFRLVALAMKYSFVDHFLFFIVFVASSFLPYFSILVLYFSSFALMSNSYGCSDYLKGYLSLRKHHLGY
jgi:hypothetical protein